MAKIHYRSIRLSNANKERLETINSIITEYQNDGYVLTLRQLYYQLVSRDVIPNKPTEYAKLSGLLKEGRMAGIVDWDAIEDRLRRPEKPAAWDSPKEIIESAVSQYARPRMEGQENYIEVWVEKDALSGVLKRVTQKYHIPIVVNRGYSSVTAMHDAFNRFVDAADNKGQKITILYLGDFDPSGVDMVRDITDRIKEFFIGSMFVRSKWYELSYDQQDNFESIENYGSQWVHENITILPIALTMAQIKQYNPPPNPAKITDPRAADYIKKYGNTSWEVDALPPPVLNALLTDAITNRIDEEKYDEVVASEKADKVKIKKLLKEL